MYPQCFPWKLYIYLALYLQHLSMSTGSRAAVEEAVHAFAWIHQAAELPSPTNDPLVKVVATGRTLSHTGIAHCKEETIY